MTVTAILDQIIAATSLSRICPNRVYQAITKLALGVKSLIIIAYNCRTITIHYTLSWRRQWHPTPALLPGKSHGQRSLVGCSPWGRKESDTTERLPFHFSLSCIGEGNGNPLRCSCLENPRDGEPGRVPSTGSHRVGHD